MYWLIGAAVVLAVVCLLAWRYDRRRGPVSVDRRNPRAEQGYAEGAAGSMYNDYGPGGSL